MQAVGDRNADIAGPRLAGLVAAFDDQLAGRGAFRHLGDHERIRPTIDGRADVADRDARPVRLGEAFAANLQLAAGDRRGRRDLGDLRVVRSESFRSRHTQ